jgi:hypothetical protein
MDRIGAWHESEAKMLVQTYCLVIVLMNAKHNKIWVSQQGLAQQVPDNLV